MSNGRVPFPAGTSPPLAALRGAGKRYGAVAALVDVDVDVRAGEVLAVLGANGAGKSTALGLLTGRIGADSGRAELFGGDPRNAVARRGIGVMLQETRLPDTLRVAEHIHLFSSYYADPRPVAQTLELAGLTEIAKRPYAALSGGQQRRVQFALAICGRPALLFVDEPTVGLDVEARRGVWQVLRQLRDDGAGIVLTTHYLEEADALADRVVLLAGGRVLAQDTAAGIKSRAASVQVRARTTLDLAQVAAFAEAESVALEDGVTRVHCRRPEALLRRWLAADAHLADLDVRGLNLEDAFVSLTASHARATQP
ncbi:ABC transporter ATP-binding protein [Chiayiivirga flava]|uniref:ABC-2 type transport system ATP-binding protein n=1 Tax=Chiayiivirga flava TaxID=659595 RepID=A0A7W8DB03_9GAMM|nr:ABC transporter ATP-binding protein [Chiayiivirga flava]MBB5209418.1 ABC-2 type transport system ATP-binding protein [Chiayiivirga flava]